MKRIIQLFYILTLLLIFASPSRAQDYWSPEQVYYGTGGKLTYTPDEEGNIIPDFSHVGYRYGDEDIPDIPTVVEVEPVEGDAGATIQQAINSLSSKPLDANGFRGAVLLKKGTYHVAGQITIGTSGVVLRGEGDTDEGTVIIAEGTSDRPLIRVTNNTTRKINSASYSQIRENYVPVGRKYVIVTNGSSFKPGDQIAIYRPGTAQWISDLKMDQIPPRSDGGAVSQWKPSTYSFYFERILTKVSGDTLFFRNPTVMAIDTKYGGGAVYKYTFDRMQNFGIEDLCLKSAYAYETDEAHSWTGISILSAEHGWVRNVTAWYFAFGCVQLERTSKFITVTNCHMRKPKSVITGSRRYSFQIIGSLNLVTDCTSDDARHDYATSSTVTGPNVFTKSTAINTHADIGPHHRWAMGTLYDSIISDGKINVQDRDNSGSGHGWAGANQVLWNCQGSASICQNPWVSAKNYNFGFIGLKENGVRPGRPDGVWVGHNRPGIFPASLYDAQLNERKYGTKIFSMLPEINMVDGTTLIIKFSLPPDPDLINEENIEITSPQDIENFVFNISLEDSCTLLISSESFNQLPSNETITVSTPNLKTEEGVTIEGISSLTYVMPDLRPIITGESQFVDNVTGSVKASSSSPGYIYFVTYDLKLTTVAELDSMINISQGRVVIADMADTQISISAKGLPGGYYQYYAVDNAGRVSEPSKAWVAVTELGPIVGIENINTFKSTLSVYQNNSTLIINPGDEEQYTLDILDLTGKKIKSLKSLNGTQTVEVDFRGKVFIFKKTSKSGVDAVKIILN